MTPAEGPPGRADEETPGRGARQAPRSLWGSPAAVGLLFLSIGALYLASVPGVWFIFPDSAIYVGLARSLVQGGGYTFNHAPFGKYPPVFPLMLAAVYRTLGPNFQAMQALVALCGVGALAATFALVKARAGAGPAFAVTLLAALSNWFWAHSTVYLLAGMPYTFFSLLALWQAERAMGGERLPVWRWLAVCAAALAAVYTHLSGAALVAAVAAGVVLSRDQKWPVRQRLLAAALLGVLCTAAAGAWLWRGHGLYGTASYDGILKRAGMGEFDETVDKPVETLQSWAAAPLSWRYSRISLPVAGLLLAALVLPGLGRAFRRHRGGPEFYLVVYFVVVAIVGGVRGRERYVVPAVPLLFYYGYLSLKVLAGWAARLFRRRSARADRLPRWLAAAAVLALLSTAIYNRKECRWGADLFSARDRKRAARDLEEWQSAAAWAQDHLPPDAHIQAGGGDSWAIVSFFLERPTRFSPLPGETGEPLIHYMLAWGADYALEDKMWRTRERLTPVIRRYRDCFASVYEAHSFTLYKLDREKLAALLKSLEAAGATAGDPPP